MRHAGVTILALASAAVVLAGCVSPPSGPHIAAMPGPHKSFEAFQQDQYACETYASDQVAGGAERANNRAVATTAIATGVGAAIGAVTGGGRSTAKGLAIGGGIGALLGADQSARAQHGLQWRYDTAYAQCMTSKGNTVQNGPYYGYPPPGYYPPPPPPGY